MTRTESLTLAESIVRDLCQLQALIDEGTTEQKQIGRDAMDLVAEQLTALGLTDEIISRAAWQLTRE